MKYEGVWFIHFSIKGLYRRATFIQIIMLASCYIIRVSACSWTITSYFIVIVNLNWLHVIVNNGLQFLYIDPWLPPAIFIWKILWTAIKFVFSPSSTIFETPIWFYLWKDSRTHNKIILLAQWEERQKKTQILSRSIQTLKHYFGAFISRTSINVSLQSHVKKWRWNTEKNILANSGKFHQ